MDWKIDGLYLCCSIHYKIGRIQHTHTRNINAHIQLLSNLLHLNIHTSVIWQRSIFDIFIDRTTLLGLEHPFHMSKIYPKYIRTFSTIRAVVHYFESLGN